jgi:hypothetical protein
MDVTAVVRRNILMRIKSIMCDIDGTVALHDGLRGHFEYEKVLIDLPNMPIIDLLGLLLGNVNILFVTGRPERCREDTTTWLGKYLFQPNDEELFMRPDFLPNGKHDYRKDYIVKEEIYRNHIEQKHDIILCLDDRKQVVDMWRSIGLTCLQVAEGNF